MLNDALSWFTKVTLEAGYRYLAVDYDDSGFVWDVSMQGPVVGVKFRF